MSNHIQDLARARLILANARALYEKYDAGRPDPFNVFTVLRSRSDEVNLHSRFLHALLDHREPVKEKTRRNLEDFLETVAEVKDFDIRDAKVQREKDNIDLLITNLRANPQWAVVVENKIWAGDQPQQLERYYQSVSDIPGINKADIRTLYLTPYGHEASEDSAGSIGYKCVSYKDHILPWLEACQRRAVNNPPLRESLAQYMEVVRGLTGLNIDIRYMEELKNLCLEKDNFVLVSHLSKAHEEACIHLVAEMWEKIKDAMKSEFGEILETRLNLEHSCVSQNGNLDEGKIEKAIIPNRGKNIQSSGLFYTLKESNRSDSKAPSFAIELGSDGLWYGIRCARKSFETEFEKIKTSLSGEPGDDKISRWGWWPWGRNAFDKLGIDYLRIGEGPEEWLRLKNKDLVKQCAEEIARELKEIWEILKKENIRRLYGKVAKPPYYFPPVV